LVYVIHRLPFKDAWCYILGFYWRNYVGIHGWLLYAWYVFWNLLGKFGKSSQKVWRNWPCA
jgi:hypothetical protein